MLDDAPSEAMSKYLGKQHEIHTVMFEGHLGSFTNQIEQLLRLKQRLKKVMLQLHSGEPVEALEWRVTDID